MSKIEKYFNNDEFFFLSWLQYIICNSFCLKKMSKKGSLNSINPEIRNILNLKQSLAFNNLSKNYYIDNIALLTKDSDIFFEFSEQSNLHKINSTLSPENHSYRKIKSFSFDSYFSDKKYPTFVKIDSEGAEIELLDWYEGILSKIKNVSIDFRPERGLDLLIIFREVIPFLIKIISTIEKINQKRFTFLFFNPNF